MPTRPDPDPPAPRPNGLTAPGSHRSTPLPAICLVPLTPETANARTRTASTRPQNLATTATALTNVGNAPITQGSLINAANANYNITYVPGTLTINKASLSAVGQKVYDGSVDISAASMSVSGVNGETFSISGYATMQSKNVQWATLNGVSTVTTQQLANVNGLTIASNGGALISNYLPLDVTNTVITVTVKPISLTAPVINKTYDAGYSYSMKIGRAHV